MTNRPPVDPTSGGDARELVSIIVPTYHEVDNLRPLLERIAGAMVSAKLPYEVIVVDDNSADGTEQIAATLVEEGHPLRLIVRKTERGLSTAVIRGLVEAHGDTLVSMDADLSHPPEKLPDMVAAARSPKVDFVLASRYISGAAIQKGWGLFRKLNSWVAVTLAKPFTNASDPMSGYFALTRRRFQSAAPLDPVGYKIALELIVKCRCHKIKEVPIFFADRQHGESKLNMREQLNYLQHIKRLANFRYGTLSHFLQFCLLGRTPHELGASAEVAEEPVRIRHSQIPVFLLGGLVGSGLNVAVSAACFYELHWSALLSFFLGTICNELFHHVYYHVLCVNQEIRLRTPVLLQLFMYVVVALLGLTPLWLLMNVAGAGFILAVLGAIALLSALNLLTNRVATFSSAPAAELEYREVDESFYDDQTDAGKVGWFRAWFHTSRYVRLKETVAEYYKPGMAIADLGCGNCWWNHDGLPVTGVDINEKMLQWALRHGRIKDFRVEADLADTHLPDHQFDIVVMSEVLEHLLDLQGVLAEVKRILKPDGRLIITVPYDIFLGPFFVLFNIQCLYRGYIKGSQYYRYRCGHINHFTKTRLRRTVQGNGFSINRLFVVNNLTLYAVVEKASLGAPGTGDQQAKSR